MLSNQFRQAGQKKIIKIKHTQNGNASRKDYALLFIFLGKFDNEKYQGPQ